jgi:microcystin-dependent protein
MADTLTANYQWVKPEIGSSNSSWGDKLNTNFDGVDATVFSLSTKVSGYLATDATGAHLTLNKPAAGVYSGAFGQTNGLDRWAILLGDAAAEGGSNAGSNFAVERYSDAGALIDSPITINRATGVVTLAQQPQAANDAATKAYVDSAGGLPVGGIAMFAGSTAPANFLLCDGSSYPTATYPALFNVIGYAFGGSGANFNVPNMCGRSPAGVGTATDSAGSTITYTLAQQYGEFWHTLTTSELAAHSHGVSDPTHNHAVNDPSHTHGDEGHSHSDAGHSHSPAGAQAFWLYSGSGLGSGAYIGSNMGAGGMQNGYANIETGYANLSHSNTGIYNSPSGTGVAIQNAGGGAEHNTVHPVLAVNFIIRAQ